MVWHKAKKMKKTSQEVQTQKPSHNERQKGQVENKIKVETQVQDEIESLCITINASLQNCFAAPDTKDIIEVQFCLTRFNGNLILQ